MKGALASIRTFSAAPTSTGETFPVWVLTDLTGPYYTLVFESTFENLAAYEHLTRSEMATEEWREWYKTLVTFYEGVIARFSLSKNGGANVCKTGPEFR